MDVLLDTNAVRASGIDGVAFRALSTYLRRTRSRLLIPSVVLEELCAQRRMLIQTLERDLKTVHKDLRRLFPEATAKPPALDASAALTVYREQLVKSADQVEILENVPDHLAELVRRLAGRIPPASPSGEEARDVLLWLTLLPVARAGRVAFISGDQKAFFRAGKLRPELLSDLGAFESNVEVFHGLDEFLRVHHARSSFIDTTWVKEQIETKQVSQGVEDFLDERSDFFERQIEENGESTGYVSLIQLVQHEVEDYFVSDVAPNELYVSVTVWAELEVEVEYYARTEGTHFREEKLTSFCECIYPCVRMQLQLQVVGEGLVAATVSAMEFA
ncbi:MAG: DUF4935 domain-containing protein [candidate division NC10 bacterium]|nr:DUF4935 domain-containing protein [candidate division NC10 bacterium]